jgi:hypothetical protein
MNKDKREKIEHVFYSAFEIKQPDERKAFLDQTCRGDDRVRRQVDEMLALQPKLDQLFPEGGLPFAPAAADLLDDNATNPSS